MKKFIFLSSLIGLLALGVFTYMPIGDQLAAAIMARDPLLRQCQALIASAYKLEPDDIDFETITSDLNADDQYEYLLRLNNKSTCGTTGCIYEICRTNGGGEVSHLRFGFSGTTLTPLDTYTQGMRDLNLNNTTILRWTGDSYDLGQQ